MAQIKTIGVVGAGHEGVVAGKQRREQRKQDHARNEEDGNQGFSAHVMSLV